MQRDRPIRVYLAGPLFTQAEWQWNLRLAEALRRSSLEVILPQNGAVPMLAGQQDFDARRLFELNLEKHRQRRRRCGDFRRCRHRLGNCLGVRICV